MTRKLYYEDPYLKTFTASVTKSEPDFIVLSETAFYPTGGGQPFDLGTINGIEVVNVEETDGEIRHYLARTFQDQDGEMVEGKIDWDRRFDHMQQHAGQHILSASFAELLGFETVGFHLGNDKSTIDLAIETISEEQLAEVEKLANSIILANYPIEIKWLSKQEAEALPLRKKLSVEDNIRLVIIPNFDYNGCGGIHPSSTGEVQGVKILSTERQKKMIRIEFVCGKRILRDLHTKTIITSKLTHVLNAPLSEIEPAITKLFDKNKMLERENRILAATVQGYEAKEILTLTEVMKGKKIIRKSFEGKTVQELQKVASSVIRLDGELNVFLVSEAGGKLQFVFSRGDQANINMKILASSILPVIEGRGGGTEKQSQGGGEAKTITAESLLQMISHQI